MSAALQFLRTEDGEERALLQGIAFQAYEAKRKVDEQLAVLIQNAIAKLFTK